MCCVFFFEVMYCARREVLRQSRAASISSMKQKGKRLISSQAKISANEVKVFSPPDSRFTRFHDLLTGLTENYTPSKGFMESVRLMSAFPPVSPMQILFSSTLIQLKHFRNTYSRLLRRSMSCPFSTSTSLLTSATRPDCSSQSLFFSPYSSKSQKSRSNSISPLPISFSRCFNFSISKECPNLTSLLGMDYKMRSESGSLGRMSDSSLQMLFLWAPSRRNPCYLWLRKEVKLKDVLPNTNAVSTSSDSWVNTFAYYDGGEFSFSGMSYGHLERVLQTINVNSFISFMDSCSLLSNSTLSIQAALSLALIFFSSSLGCGFTPFLPSLSCSSRAFFSFSISLSSVWTRLMPYWMTASSLLLVSMIQLSLNLSVSNALFCRTFSYRLSVSLDRHASTSAIFPFRLAIRLLQLAIFLTLSSLSTNSFISSRLPSQFYILNPDSFSFVCNFDRFYEVPTASRFIFDSLSIFYLSSASMSFRNTSSRPSRLLSSFYTLSRVLCASYNLPSASTILSFKEARTLLMVDCFLIRKSWSQRSLPFLSGSLVIVPDESMNSPLVVMTLYLFSSQYATFMAVSSLLVTSVFPSDHMRMFLVSSSVHLQTSQSSLVSLGQEVAGLMSLVASRMDYLMSSVILPSLRLLRKSSTSLACTRVSTMKQSRCGRMVSTTSAQAVSMMSISLRVRRGVSLQRSLSLLAERTQLIILSWLVAFFSLGLSLSCRYICCSISSFQTRSVLISANYSSRVFMSVLHFTIISLFYLYFRQQILNFSLSDSNVRLSSEHFCSSTASYRFRLLLFSQSYWQTFNLPIWPAFLNELLISLILLANCSCCSWMCPNSSISAASLPLSCCLLSLSLRAKLISRVASLTLRPALSFFCSICSMYSYPFLYYPLATSHSFRFSLHSLSFSLISPYTLTQALFCASSAYFNSRKALLLSRNIFFMTRCWSRRAFSRSSIHVVC